MLDWKTMYQRNVDNKTELNKDVMLFWGIFNTHILPCHAFFYTSFNIVGHADLTLPNPSA